ncbi:MAG: hypothetical protein ABH872_02740 [Candidatus Omnitrophota bacterium]
MVFFIILNTTVGLSAYLLVTKVFSVRSLTDRICILSVLYLSQIIATELFLGIFGFLRLNLLLALNLSILFSVWILTKSKQRSSPHYRSDISWIVTDKVILFCFCVIAGFLLIKSLINLFNPPVGWDSLNYHFSLPVEWFKNANLNSPITINDDPSPAYYPINNGLFYYWLIAPLRNVFIADLGQVPFFIISFFACFGISRKMGISKEYSFFASTLFTITPNFFKQVEIAYADIMVGALFLLTLNLLLMLENEFSYRNIILCGLSGGLFFGTKTLCLPYSVPLFILFFIIILRKGKGKFYRGAILFFLLVAALGGYSYIRNFLITGNPLFPLNFELFGNTILKGVMPSNTYRAHWSKEDYNLIKLFFHEGMGFHFFLLIFPLAVISPFIALWGIIRKRRNNVTVFFIMFLPLTLYLIFRYIIPQLWTRFLYPFLGVGSAVALYNLDKLKVPHKAVRIIVVVSVLAAASELAGHFELIVSLAASIFIFFLSPRILFFIKKSKSLLKISFAMAAIAVVSLSIIEKWYLLHEYDRYISHTPLWKGAAHAWKWLNSNTQGNRVAYVGRPVAFPLYGTNLKNDVYYVSVNSIHPAHLHLWPKGNLDWTSDFSTIHKVLRRPENYRGKADFSQWLKNIIKEKTEYLFIYSLHQTKDFPVEDVWARNHPEKFRLRFENEDSRIYQVAGE